MRVNSSPCTRVNRLSKQTFEEKKMTKWLSYSLSPPGYCVVLFRALESIPTADIYKIPFIETCSKSQQSAESEVTATSLTTL